MNECDFNMKAAPIQWAYKTPHVLDQMATNVYSANKAQGFWEDTEAAIKSADTASSPTIKAYTAQKLMLIVSEVSEALEADRKDLLDSHLPEYPGLQVELADAIIRILDMCGGYNIPIGEIVEAKLEYNASRPFKHGKAY